MNSRKLNGVAATNQNLTASNLSATNPPARHIPVAATNQNLTASNESNTWRNHRKQGSQQQIKISQQATYLREKLWSTIGFGRSNKSKSHSKQLALHWAPHPASPSQQQIKISQQATQINKTQQTGIDASQQQIKISQQATASCVRQARAAGSQQQIKISQQATPSL